MPEKLKTLLTIAGSDPTGGAGIETDIRTGISLGLHVMAAVTVVTAQNSKGIKKISSIPAEILRAQLDSIVEETIPDAIKIGMIGNIKNFKIIQDYLFTLPDTIPIIVDPVLKATSDGSHLFVNLTEKEVAKLYYFNIFPNVVVATPNLSELKILLDKKKLYLNNPGKILEELNIKNLIIKGGDTTKSEITDILLTNKGIFYHSHKKIKCKNLHGTGCAYSSLIASYMALGNPLEEAFSLSNKKMEEIISQSCDYSLGDSKYGPLNINNYRI